MILDILNAKNWVKGHGYKDIDGNVCTVENACQYCIIGAYWKLYTHWYNYTKEDNIRIKRMADTIKELWPDRYAASSSLNKIIMEFNDHPDTTFDDVKTLLELAGV